MTVVPVSQTSQLRAAAPATAVAAQQNTIQIPQIQVVQPVFQHIPGLGQVRVIFMYLYAIMMYILINVFCL